MSTMEKTFLISLSMVLLLALTALTALAGDEDDKASNADPLWPLDLTTRFLTSNFMEYRSGRFHAGLDLKTETRQGYVVRAVEDGYISRVRCTPTAYGRVIYLRADSGLTYVFAHLSRFNDDLQARVQQVQLQNSNYRARLNFKPNQIRVKKGQVLGLSGQSGTNGPHLHFEVRDRNQRPLNPLQHGFAVPDTFPPVIHSLRIWPVNAQSRIFSTAGEWAIQGSGSLGLHGDQGVVRVTGPVAFSARMIDASDIRGHKLEPYLIELELDSKVVYQCRNDRFDFSENGLQRLEWTDWADWTENGVPREHWLHRRSANSLNGRVGSLWYLGNNGEGLSAGSHELALRVSDYSGNSSEISWQMLVDPKDEKISDTGHWYPEVLGVSGLDFPELDPKVGHSLRLTPFFSTGNLNRGHLKAHRMGPGKTSSVYEEVTLWSQQDSLNAEELRLAENQGLKSLPWASRILTADWPIVSSVPIEMSLAENADFSQAEKLGIYRLKKGKEWTLVSSFNFSLSHEFLLQEPGRHALFEDTQGPEFQNNGDGLQVKKGTASGVEDVTLPVWQMTSVSLIDWGSGINTGTIMARLNDQLLIVEPDPPRDRILIHWPDQLQAGKHMLWLQAEDKAGNMAQIHYEILAE